MNTENKCESNTNSSTNEIKKGKKVFLHFSFRRPTGKKYGIFSVAYFADFEGKRPLKHETRAFTLWKDQQYICAIQAYEHALYSIWSNQAALTRVGVTDVFLVTDNCTLAGWIENPNKRLDYGHYMEIANRNYRMGEKNYIKLNIGLCEPRMAEKSHKYCKEELIMNKKSMVNNSFDASKMKRVTDIIEENKAKVSGIRVYTFTGNTNSDSSKVHIKDEDIFE